MRWQRNTDGALELLEGEALLAAVVLRGGTHHVTLYSPIRGGSADGLITARVVGSWPSSSRAKAEAESMVTG